MNPPHLLIVGCGDIGTRVGLALRAHDWRISALRRSPDQLPQDFYRYAGDYTSVGGLSSIAELRPDFILFSPLPSRRDTEGYQMGFRDSVTCLGASGVVSAVQHSVYVSSTRVYAESDGGWVEEDSPLNQEDPAALAIIEGEERMRALTGTTVVRPSGIYGAFPGMLLERIASGLRTTDSGRYSNRIHRDDVAGLITHLLMRLATGESLPATVNASDDAPVPIGDVEEWLAKQLGVTTMQPVAATRPVASRRVSNRLMHAQGYQLRYPDWQSGYGPLLAQWRQSLSGSR